jgi:hypothetical protein
MSVKNLYPNIEPTLNLSFALTKALDPRVSFTRASTGRFYDGKTVAKAEENLLTYSQEFDNAAWGKAAATIAANSTTAPDGTSSADTVTASAANAEHSVFNTQNISMVVGQRFVSSVFAKKNTNDYFQLSVGNQVGVFANFNISTGALETSSGIVSASITETPVGSGWYRCVMVFDAVTTDTGSRFYASIIPSGSSGRRLAYLAAGTESIFIWGAQLEQRSSVTAYTPTTTQPITNYVPVLQSAANNVARFDHNPVTGESLGLLIEEQRTNLLLRSAEFENASWTKTASSIIANTVVAPDGTLTGDKLVEDTTTGNHFIQQIPTVVSGLAHTFSVYAKAGERTSFSLLMAQSTSPFTNHASVLFDLSAGVIATTTAGSGTITAVGNGWYRCTVTGTTSSTGEICRVTFSTTGDGFSGIYIWGAQLEAGAFPTSYIPTVASQVTRSADAASMTGANFSSWYRADEGTLYVESINAGGIVGGTFGVSDGTNSNRMFVQSDTRSEQFAAFVQTLGTIQSSLTLSGAAVLTSNKVAMAYRTNDLAAVRQGGTVVTDVSATIPLVNRAIFGGSGADTAAISSGWVRKAAYYPKRLANAEIVALTQN